MSLTGGPIHPDIEIEQVETGFARFLRLDVLRFRHRLYRGGWSAARRHDVLRRGQAVAIVLYDPQRDAVVLIEQVRLAALLAGSSPWQLEVPAGLVDADVSPLTAAVREIREETGLVPSHPLLAIQRYLPSSGASDESVLLYCACVDSRSAQGLHGVPEEGEDIRVVVKSFAEVEALLDGGAIENGHSLIGLYWLTRHRERLRRLWSGPAIGEPHN